MYLTSLSSIYDVIFIHDTPGEYIPWSSPLLQAQQEEALFSKPVSQDLQPFASTSKRP